MFSAFRSFWKKALLGDSGGCLTTQHFSETQKLKKRKARNWVMFRNCVQSTQLKNRPKTIRSYDKRRKWKRAKKKGKKRGLMRVAHQAFASSQKNRRGMTKSRKTRFFVHKIFKFAKTCKTAFLGVFRPFLTPQKGPKNTEKVLFFGVDYEIISENRRIPTKKAKNVKKREKP